MSQYTTLAWSLEEAIGDNETLQISEEEIFLIIYVCDNVKNEANSRVRAYHQKSAHLIRVRNQIFRCLSNDSDNKAVTGNVDILQDTGGPLA